jgi:hypothetical protein
MAKDDEAPQIISWKAFWAAFGAVVTAAIGYLAVLADVSFPITLLAGIAVAAVFVLGGRMVVHGAHMFAEVSEDGRVQIVRWMGAGAAAHVVWIAALQIRPDLMFIFGVVLVCLAAVEYWLARAHEYLLTRLVRTPSKEVELARAQAAEGDQNTKILRATLRRARLDYLAIEGWEYIGEPEPHGMAVDVQEPSHLGLMESTGKTTTTARLSTASAEPLAIALSEVLSNGSPQRIRIMTDWIQIQNTPYGGLYRIVFATEDVMGRIYPYQDTLEWSSFEEPVLVGYQLDGQPYSLRIDQNGQLIGATREGKSSLINSILAHTTRAADGYTWICGVEKLYDLVAGWLEPYMDTEYDMPFDWIASGPQDTVEMLAAAMRIARYRQRIPLSMRKRWKKIKIIMDEASFVLKDNQTRALYEGRHYTASQLYAMLSRGAGSGGVHLLMGDQRSTMDNKGDEGGNIGANLGYAAAFRSNDAGEIGRLMGDYHLKNPRHKGEYWLKANDGTLPIRLKAPYIQEVDPMRPRLHDGLTVSDVSWARRSFTRDPLDEGSAAVAGELYARRHRRMNEDFLAYLTNVDLAPAALPAGTDEHLSEVERSAYAELAEAREKFGLDVPGAPKVVVASQAAPALPAGTAVATLDSRRSRADRIAAIVRTAEKPMTRADIVAALHADGDEVKDPQLVTNELGRLLKRGEVVRGDEGYVSAR